MAGMVCLIAAVQLTEGRAAWRPPQSTIWGRMHIFLKKYSWIFTRQLIVSMATESGTEEKQHTRRMHVRTAGMLAVARWREGATLGQAKGVPLGIFPAF